MFGLFSRLKKSQEAVETIIQQLEIQMNYARDILKNDDEFAKRLQGKFSRGYIFSICMRFGVKDESLSPLINAVHNIIFGEENYSDILKQSERDMKHPIFEKGVSRAREDVASFLDNGKDMTGLMDNLSNGDE